MGGGVIGTCVAYYLVKEHGVKVTMIDPCASIDGSPFEPPAASGKAGGFLARSWCDGQVTEQLTQLSYRLHQELSFLPSEYRELTTCSATKMPQLCSKLAQDDGKTTSTTSTTSTTNKKHKRNNLPSFCDRGRFENVQETGNESNCAQVTPEKFVQALQAETMKHGTLDIVRGRVVGVVGGGGTTPVQSIRIETTVCGGGGGGGSGEGEDGTTATLLLPCSAFVVAAGPWSNLCRKWGAPFTSLPPIEGLKAHSMVFEAAADAVAFFVGLGDSGKEIEYYPRPDGSVYVCGEGADDSSVVEERPGRVHVSREKIKELRRNSAGLSSLFDAADVRKESACHLPVVISSDGAPLICELEQGSRCFVGTGHTCWGILQGPGTGKCLAELIAGKPTSVDLTAFATGLIGER